MPKAGLEPAQISPYAPETYVSTIPPLRHRYNITTLLLNFQEVQYFGILSHSMFFLIVENFLTSN